MSSTQISKNFFFKLLLILVFFVGSLLPFFPQVTKASINTGSSNLQTFTEIIDAKDYINKNILIRVDGGIIDNVFYEKSDGTYQDIDGYSSNSEKGIIYGNYWYEEKLATSSNGLSSDPAHQTIKLVIKAETSDYKVSVMNGTSQPFDFSSIKLEDGNYISLNIKNGSVSSDYSIKAILETGKEYYFFYNGMADADIIAPNGEVVRHINKLDVSNAAGASYFTANQTGEYTIKFSNGIPSIAEIYPVTEVFSDIKEIDLPIKTENVNFSSKAYLVKPLFNKALSFDATLFLNNSTRISGSVVTSEISDYNKLLKRNLSSPDIMEETYIKVDTSKLSILQETQVWSLGSLNTEDSLAKVVTFNKQLNSNKEPVTINLNGNQAKPNSGNFVKEDIQNICTREELESLVGDPVDSATGAFIDEKQLLSYSGNNPLSLKMQYNSIANDSKALGGGWTHNFETWIEKSEKEIIVYWNPNSKNVFTNTNGKWVPKDTKNTFTELTVMDNGSYQVKNKRTQETFTFNSDGLLIEKKNRNSITTTFAYDIKNRLTEVKNEKGQSFTFTYNSYNKITNIKDISGREVTFTYNSYKLLSSMTNVNGDAMNVTYTNLGTSSQPDYKIKSISYGTNKIIENQYDSYGRVTYQKDSLGQGTTFEYDDYTEEGTVKTRVIDRRGNAETFIHDSSFQLTKKIDKKGYVKSFTYDEKGNRISETDFKGNVSKYSYDDIGFLTKELYPNETFKQYEYDSNGNQTKLINEKGKASTNVFSETNLLTSITDLNGNQTTFVYDSYGNIKEVTDPKGNKTINQYDGNGYLISSSDKEGNKITYVNDSLGRVTKVALPDGTVTEFIYDAIGRVVQTKDNEGNITKNEYDILGNLIQSTDKLGRVTTYTYDENSNKISQKNGEREIVYTYDEEGNLLSEGDKASNSLTTYKYDANGLLISKTSPVGNTVTYEYDKNGNITKETDKDGSTSYEYDEMNRMVSKTNAKGKKTTYSYDEVSLLEKEISPTGNEITYSYDNMGNLISTIDGSGHATTQEYDSTNLLTKTTNARNKETQYIYNENGQLIETINALGQSTKIRYNKNGKVSEEINAAGEVTAQYTYDSLGRLIKKTDGLEHSISFKYDPVGNLLETYDGKGNLVESNEINLYNEVSSTTDALQRKTSYSYDTKGNLIKLTDPLSRVTSYDYDKDDRLTKVTDPSETVSYQTFSETGLLQTYKDNNGNTTTLSYSPTGTLTSEINETGNKLQYEYNDDDLVSKYTNGRGDSAVYSYDKAGNLVKIVEGEQTIEFIYSETNKVTEIKETGKGTIERVYDDLDRVIQYKDQHGNIIQYEYDQRGYLSKVIYPGNLSVTYEYNVAGNLAKVTDWNGKVTTYQYDENNRLIQTKKPDGSLEKRTYDVAGQLTKLESATSSGKIISSISYEYDAAGNIIKENDKNLSYDVLNRLIKKDDNTYHYDAAGNLLQSSVVKENQTLDSILTYGKDNQLKTINGANVTFDEDGNLIKFTLDNKEFTGVYDQRNRLTNLGGLEYQYDVEDNRTVITENGKETRFVIDSVSSNLSRVLMETDESGTPTKYYVYGIGLINEYGPTNAASEAKVYHFDHRGSTIAQTDLDGTIIGEVSYDVYGEIVNKDDTVQTRFLFNGRDGVQTDSNGLYYMRARYYSPDLKRFINRDVVSGNIEESQTFNRYAYVNGNPISYIDPFGLSRDPSILGTIGNWIITGVDYAQIGLDYAGFIPGVGAIPDGVNAGIYFVRGDNSNAALSAVAMIPVAGDAIKGGSKVAKGFVKYGDLDTLGRATQAEAYITKDMIGKGTKANNNIKPAGFVSGLKPISHNRGHIIARDLGGDGNDVRNLTTLHRQANSPVMRKHEQDVKKVVMSGENVFYKSTPNYRGNEPLSRGITIEAKGDNGYYKYVTILNKGK